VPAGTADARLATLDYTVLRAPCCQALVDKTIVKS
jgi:hypothetical protein